MTEIPPCVASCHTRLLTTLLSGRSDILRFLTAPLLRQRLRAQRGAALPHSTELVAGTVSGRRREKSRSPIIQQPAIDSGCLSTKARDGLEGRQRPARQGMSWSTGYHSSARSDRRKGMIMPCHHRSNETRLTYVGLAECGRQISSTVAIVCR